MSFFRLSCFVLFFFSCFVLLYVVLFVMTLQNWLKYTLLGLINSAQDALCVVSVACKVQNLFSYWECKRDSMGYIHIPLFLWKLSFILWFIDSSNVPCWVCVLFQEALLSRLSSSLIFHLKQRRFRVHNVHVLLMWSFHNRVLIVRNVPIVHSSPIPWPLSPPSIYHPGQYRTPSGLSVPLT